MGECYITRRGGSGGGKAFAVIGVTYPAGSVCTCTDGTKTLTLKDTGGQGFFLIPYAAVWTVAASDGTNTKSQSVEITSKGQSESVELKYEEYLIKDGIQLVQFTSLNFTINSEDGAVKINYGGSGFHNFRTSDKIDISKYNTLNGYIKNSAGNPKNFGIYSSTDFGDAGNNAIASFQMPISDYYANVTVDISSISGTYYIGIGASGNKTHTCYIKDIWLA